MFILLKAFKKLAGVATPGMENSSFFYADCHSGRGILFYPLWKTWHALNYIKVRLGFCHLRGWFFVHQDLTRVTYRRPHYLGCFSKFSKMNNAIIFSYIMSSSIPSFHNHTVKKVYQFHTLLFDIKMMFSPTILYLVFCWSLTLTMPTNFKGTFNPLTL